MDNQHRHIKGYRELNEHEINLVNHIKGQGERLDALISRLQSREGIDQRWVSIGQTHLQQGLMALIRGITKPESF